MIWPARIMTPLHVHSVATPEDYLRLQLITIQRGMTEHPFLNWRLPRLSKERPTVFITGGKLLVRCTDCRNYPSVHPEWRLACCLECGAIYLNLDIPERLQEIEEVLVQRPHPSNRAWFPDETLDDLKRENIEHGYPIK